MLLRPAHFHHSCSNRMSSRRPVARAVAIPAAAKKPKLSDAPGRIGLGSLVAWAQVSISSGRESISLGLCGVDLRILRERLRQFDTQERSMVWDCQWVEGAAWCWCECKEVFEPLLMARVSKLLLCKAQVKTIFRAGGGVPFSSVCVEHVAWAEERAFIQVWLVSLPELPHPAARFSLAEITLEGLPNPAVWILNQSTFSSRAFKAGVWWAVRWQYKPGCAAERLHDLINWLTLFGSSNLWW